MGRGDQRGYGGDGSAWRHHSRGWGIESWGGEIAMKKLFYYLKGLFSYGEKPVQVSWETECYVELFKENKRIK